MTAPAAEAAAYDLTTKYTLEEGRVFLSGTQALVRILFDQLRADRRAGLRTGAFISGYPGSPMGGMDRELHVNSALLKAHDVVFTPGLNEELAMTAVVGTQMLHLFPTPRYDGVVGVWYGKGQGIDRSLDALKHANFAGSDRNGGALAIVGDDPNAKSSTFPTPAEGAFFDAVVPTLFPGTVQEIVDLGLHGIALSRVAGLVAGLKIVNNLADSVGTVDVSPRRVTPVAPVVELDGRPYVHEFTLPYTLEQERTLLNARLEIARRYAWENGLNEITAPTPGAWLGIVAGGKTYYDVREALLHLGLDEAALAGQGIRLLRMGMLYPVEPRIVREFAQGLEEILVVEEKRPFLELFVKDILYPEPRRPTVVGSFDEEDRPLVQMNAELDPDLVARAIARRLARRQRVASAETRIALLDEVKRRQGPPKLARIPFFCSGCPHNRSTPVPEGSVATPGIGCHALAMMWDPAYKGLTQMGGEGAHWIGLSHFTGTPHLFQHLGDGTLHHSGSLAIRATVAAGVNVTFKILYNSAVAMTGGQEVTGMRSVPELTRMLEAEGVKRIIITSDDPGKYRGAELAPGTEVWHRDRIMEAQQTLAAVPGVTAMIHDGLCAAEKRRLRKRGKLLDPARLVVVNEAVCEGCGDCSRKSNCLSVQTVDTELGPKTFIHQSSCNKDYSCLLGDCPSFLEVEPAASAPVARRSFQLPQVPLPEPALAVTADGFAVRMTGIGGTGVVTVNQIVGTAAMLAGFHVTGLDQTGVSQKGGPVVSDLKIARRPLTVGNKVMTGGADLYLGLDVLVAAMPQHLAAADPRRTVAIVSTTQVPTGQMVRSRAVEFPHVDQLRSEIDVATRRADNVYLDARAHAERLFGDHMAANMLVVGVAFQSGALPLPADRIEQAIRLNGSAVEMNVAAFRWGRALVAHPELAARHATPRAAEPADARVESIVPHRLVSLANLEESVRRVVIRRVPELVAYQGEAYARRYVEFVRDVAAVEEARTPGRHEVAEGVARNLYKLMAYKDEYEVARLHLAGLSDVHARFGDGARVRWLLHPPALRALGLGKIRVGAWFKPVFGLLRSMRFLRGTWLDPFGHAQVRRTERALVGEYRDLVSAALARLTPETHATVVTLAGLPEAIRGYEELKLAAVKQFRERAQALSRELQLGLERSA